MSGKVRSAEAVLGIRRACAFRLAEESEAVAATDVMEKEREALVQEICAYGGQAVYWYLDVWQESGVKRVLARVMLELGKVTVLMNNARIIGTQKPTHQITPEQWDALLAGRTRPPSALRRIGRRRPKQDQLPGISGEPIRFELPWWAIRNLDL